MYIQNGVSVIILKRKEKKRIGTSMRVHVFAALLFVGIIPAYLGLLRIGTIYKEDTFAQRTEQMEKKAQELVDQIASAGYLSNTNQPEITAKIQMLAELYEGRVLLVNNGLVIQKDSFGREEGKTLISEEAIKGLRGEKSFYYNQAGKSMEIALPVKLSEGKECIGTFIVNYSVDDLVVFQENFQKNCGTICFLLLIFGSIYAFVASGRMTWPIRKITNSVHQVTEGYMEEGLSIQGYKEVEQMAEAFNHLLEQMKTAEATRQEFVSNVSHELKTPLASIKILADSLITQPDAPIEMYQEFMQDINSEIERETKIVNDLLSLVKLDRKSGEMHIAEVSINELIEILMNRLKPLAIKRGIEMVFESYRSVLAEVDEIKLSLVLTNLIENAIKYNRDGGFVKVSLNADHKYFYIKVEDSGVGIPEDEQKLIFDRFYRVDKARSRETGGSGLGLSIAKNAVLMHKGSIKVNSTPGEGAVFSIRIPLNFIL